jgi:ParB family chromosome partitioning protein
MSVSSELLNKYKNEILKFEKTDGYCTDLPVELVQVRHNVRLELNLDEEFIESVRQQGVLQPILVTVVDNDDRKKIIICIAGHRRLAAAKTVGLPFIKCVSKKLPGKAATVAALSENVNRAALHPLDLAESFHALELQGTTKQEMESLFNRDKKTIARFIKMADWTAETKELIRGHPEFFSSRILLALASKRATPREIEKIVRSLVQATPKPRSDRRTTKKSISQEIEKYFEKSNLAEHEKKIILDALDFLKLLPSEGSD